MSFNVFTFLNFEMREELHTNMIGGLLKEKQYPHFLLNFFEKVLKKDSTFLQIAKNHEWTVKTEEVVDNTDKGRLDLRISSKEAGHLIIIENKIKANEGASQIDKYWNWVGKQQDYLHKKIWLLSPDGRESVSSTMSECERISYSAIIEWINSCLSEDLPPRLKETLLQYIEIVKPLIPSDKDDYYQDIKKKSNRLLPNNYHKEKVKVIIERLRVSLSDSIKSYDFFTQYECDFKYCGVYGIPKEFSQSDHVGLLGVRVAVHLRNRAHTKFLAGLRWVKTDWKKTNIDSQKNLHETDLIREKCLARGWSVNEKHHLLGVWKPIIQLKEDYQLLNQLELHSIKWLREAEIHTKEFISLFGDKIYKINKKTEELRQNILR